jgi:hypothetical protein
MARKKKVRRAKRTVRRTRNLSSKHSNPKNKIKLVFNNLLLFIALSLVSLVAYRLVSNEILINLFQVMAMVFGFVSVGFLITLLVLFIIKIVKKR